MKLFYFVGGPTAGYEDEFRRRLAAVGGSPSGWTVFPHRDDREALHLVRTADVDDIDAHLGQLGAAYERGPIVELLDASQAAGAAPSDDEGSRARGRADT